MFTERGQGLIRWGVGLLLLSVLSGFLIPRVSDPVLGLAAHIQGLLNAFMILIVGVIWSRIQLGYLGAVVAYWGLIVGAYATLFAQVVSAALGIGGSIFPIVAAGHIGTPLQEKVVTAVVEGSAVVTTIAVLLVAWGAFRKPRI